MRESSAALANSSLAIDELHVDDKVYTVSLNGVLFDTGRVQWGLGYLDAGSGINEQVIQDKAGGIWIWDMGRRGAWSRIAKAAQ